LEEAKERRQKKGSQANILNFKPTKAKEYERKKKKERGARLKASRILGAAECAYLVQTYDFGEGITRT
jgi:hypothetical protein